MIQLGTLATPDHKQEWTLSVRLTMLHPNIGWMVEVADAQNTAIPSPFRSTTLSPGMGKFLFGLLSEHHLVSIQSLTPDLEWNDKRYSRGWQAFTYITVTASSYNGEHWEMRIRDAVHYSEIEINAGHHMDMVSALGFMAMLTSLDVPHEDWRGRPYK